MRTAILISGYLRTLKSNLDNLLNKIVYEFDNVDIYIHLTMDEKLNDRYLNIHYLHDDIKLIQKKLNPICLICEPNLSISTNPLENDTVNKWSKYFKLNQIKKCNEQLYGKYDLVIKYRPDLHIFSDKIDVSNIKNDTVYIPSDAKIDIQKLKDKNDNYICDILAYGSSNIMDRYFSIQLSIGELMKKHGTAPETLLYEYLTSAKIKYKLVNIDYGVILSSCNVFAICGDSGSGKTTLSNILKQYFNNSFLLECDRYHKWERHNKNWKKFTHLNPEANYLAKIQDDVFNLKLGKTVYRVNYDHNNGKFTDEERIYPSNNIIVCGLHSLYGNNEHIYDFKIFMDTNDELKLKWKIERDTNERGHNINNVLNQIDERKDDFQKFIYPQRDKSDLIVNFFVNPTSADISLRLLVNNKYNIADIVSEMDDKGVKYTLDTEGQFIAFTFNNYYPIKTYKKCPSTNDFYDYIIFFIFRLKN